MTSSLPRAPVGRSEPPRLPDKRDAPKLFGKLALSVALGALFVFVMRRGGIPILPTEEGLGRVSWPVVALFVATFIVAHWVRAARWRHLIRPIKIVSFQEGMYLNWIGFFAIFILPLRVGEMARPALSKLRLQIPVSVGLGTVAVERILDGLITSLCVVFAVIVLPHPESDVRLLRYYAYAALVGFGAAFLGLFLFLWQKELALRLIRATFGLISTKLGAFVEDKVGGVADGILCLRDRRLAVMFTLESLAYWGLNATAMWILALGCDIPLTFPQAVGLMGVLAIGVLLPAAPGMFGSFHSFLFVGLHLYFAGEVAAALEPRFGTYVFLLYVLQAAIICIFGIAPLYKLNLRFQDMLRTR